MFIFSYMICYNLRVLVYIELDNCWDIENVLNVIFDDGISIK